MILYNFISITNYLFPMPLPYLYIHAQYTLTHTHSLCRHIPYCIIHFHTFEFTMHRQTHAHLQSLNSHHRKMNAIYYCSKCWWSLSFSTTIAALNDDDDDDDDCYYSAIYICIVYILMMLSSITSHYSCVCVCVFGPSKKRWCKYNQ